MVRTKADRVPTKAVGAKAPHKVASTTGAKKTSGNGKGKSYSGGNPYHPRETPEWQKPITNFMNQNVTKERDVSSKSNENVENNTSDTSIEIDTDQN
ncbi:PCNA-associated factor-like [Vespa velutina]|uniref:PCNA-associated factor-like n=1 Tax=Vespa velutina TaxID=202808 RepID=UPI001FB2890E|nr:PCNA-associated factor-like [Vespa velutina]